MRVNTAVHPRVCGERTVCGVMALSPSGSSPRVRGTLSASHAAAARRRFIPACAGNAGPLTIEPSLFAVHPRVCGERGMRSFATKEGTGSSPRVRGTREPIC